MASYSEDRAEFGEVPHLPSVGLRSRSFPLERLVSQYFDDMIRRFIIGSSVGGVVPVILSKEERDGA